MASEAAQVAVESDFLFGLRKSDTRHAKVVTALEMHREGSLRIALLSSAIVEVRAVLYSRGAKGKDVEEAFSLMAALLADYGVSQTLPLTLSDAIVAEKMRADHPALTFFDSLHAATSKRSGATLLSSEGSYERMGLPFLDLDRLRRPNPSD